MRRDITFSAPYSEAPAVLACIVSGAPASNRASVVNVTTTGFVLVTNRASAVPAGQGDDAYWIAIGK